MGKAASSKTVETRAHTTPDGVLNLRLQVAWPDADVAVVVQVRPVAQSQPVDANGWPVDFFERVAGSMPTLERPPQGEYERRLQFQ